jgi:hypothetical protein
MDVSMSGGRVTDLQGHAAATSLVTAGTDAVRVIRDQLDLPPPDTS